MAMKHGGLRRQSGNPVAVGLSPPVNEKLAAGRTFSGPSRERVISPGHTFLLTWELI